MAEETAQALESETRLMTPEHVWAIAGPTVGTAFREEVIPFLTQATMENYEVVTLGDVADRGRESLQGNIDTGLEQEEQFVKDVSATVIEAIQQNPEATEYVVYFDIDETIARRSMHSNKHLVRPSVVPLMATMQGMDPRIKFGLLTSRSQEYLDDELANPNELAALVPYLDPSRVKSSREEPYHTWSPYEPNPTSKYIPSDDIAVMPGIQQKVSICERELEADPDISIVLVDDIPGAEAVMSDNRFRTLGLDQENGFWVRF